MFHHAHLLTSTCLVARIGQRQNAHTQEVRAHARALAGNASHTTCMVEGGARVAIVALALARERSKGALEAICAHGLARVWRKRAAAAFVAEQKTRDVAERAHSAGLAVDLLRQVGECALVAIVARWTTDRALRLARYAVVTFLTASGVHGCARRALDARRQRLDVCVMACCTRRAARLTFNVLIRACVASLAVD